MTDEEIEKVVARCRKETCTGCSFYRLSGCLAVVDYIKRLKDEIAGLTGTVDALETDNDNLTRTLEETNEEIKTVRNETAKEILDEVSKHYGGTWLIELYKKYGVEVEE